MRWYKLDPATETLFELPGNVSFDGNTAMVELVDGGLGDFDGTVNGVIVDPSGPLAIPAGGSQADDGGGSNGGWLLPALLAAAGIRIRRRGAIRASSAGCSPRSDA